MTIEHPDPGPHAVARHLAEIVGEAHVASGLRISDDDTHDECLTVDPVRPLAVVRPATTTEVAAVVSHCDGHGITVTARGGGTGLSGACVGHPAGIVVAFDRMASVIEVDVADQMAVVQPGVTLARLDEILAPYGLFYPVQPGEASATVGGTVATNAGGMRAVRFGVTRNHVVGLELVLASGTVLRCGGRLAKISTGYDLTQLVIGSEGTLALVTEVTIRLQRRPTAQSTLLVPFGDLPTLAAAIAPLVASGVEPSMLEYVDLLSMAGITRAAGIELGVEPAVSERSSAYLLVGLQSRDPGQLDDDAAVVGTVLGHHGALEVYVLPPSAGAALVEARERAFFAAKAAGADDIVDVVVPRSAIPDLLARAADLAAGSGTLVTGCGHVGDGNVHLSVFQPDKSIRSRLLDQIFTYAVELGGAVSGEHGIGRAKQAAFAALADPAHVSLLRQIKQVFDPRGTLGPGVGPVAAPVSAPPRL
jgi:glycolate oxidase